MFRHNRNLWAFCEIVDRTSSQAFSLVAGGLVSYCAVGVAVQRVLSSELPTAAFVFPIVSFVCGAVLAEVSKKSLKQGQTWSTVALLVAVLVGVIVLGFEMYLMYLERDQMWIRGAGQLEFDP